MKYWYRSGSSSGRCPGVKSAPPPAWCRSPDLRIWSLWLSYLMIDGGGGGDSGGVDDEQQEGGKKDRTTSVVTAGLPCTLLPLRLMLPLLAYVQQLLARGDNGRCTVTDSPGALVLV